MRVRATFSDESVWEGEHPDLLTDCPDGYMVRLDVEHPEGCRVTFAGWDHIGIRPRPEGIYVVQWKDEDATDADGSPDPYAGMWGSWLRGLDGEQEFDGYHRNPPPAVDRAWPGLWLTDDVARRVGVL